MAKKAGTGLTPFGDWAFWRARFPTVLLSAFAVLAVWFPLTNTDIWWHLLAGKTILQSGIPFTDSFTVHAQGKPWVDLHWGFQLGAFGLFKLGGPAALVLAKCLIFALGAWLLLKAVEAGQGSTIRPVVVLVLVILIAAGRSFVFARPTLLSLLFLSAFLFLLERFVADRNWRWLIGLPLVEVLWVNVQPLHVLGPVVLGFYLVGEGLATGLTRKGFSGFAERIGAWQMGILLLCLVTVLLAGLVSPYLFDAYRLPLGLLSRIDPTAIDLYSWQVSENVPSWQLARSGDPSSGALSWIASVTFASFLFCWRRICLSRLALAGAFFILALMANRNILLFFWVAGPVIAMNISPSILGHWSRHPKGISARLLGSSVPALVAAVSLGAVFFLPALKADISQAAPFRIPEGSADLLQSSKVAGPVFCSVRYGGYLAWRLAPEVRPYIDGRLVLTTPESFTDYLAALDHGERFDSLHASHGFAAVVLPVAMPDRFRSLVRHLLLHPDWRLVYTDGTETLFVPRSNPGFQELALGEVDQLSKILAGLDLRFGQGSREREQALIHLALLLALGGHHTAADELLADLSGPDARAVQARNLFLDGRLERAETISMKLLEDHPDHLGSLNVLARIAVQRGQARQAVEFAGRSLEADPFDLEARGILEAIGDSPAELPIQGGGGHD